MVARAALSVVPVRSGSSQRLERVLAVAAFAERRARYSSLEALAVLLLALAGLALAALEVHLLVGVDLRLEGVDIAFENLLDSLLAIHLVLGVVVALPALPRALASWPAGRIVAEALTVEFEAPGVPALAAFALGDHFFREELLLRDCLTDDLLSLLSNILLVLVVLLLLLLLSQALPLVGTWCIRVAYGAASALKPVGIGRLFRRRALPLARTRRCRHHRIVQGQHAIVENGRLLEIVACADGVVLHC